MGQVSIPVDLLNPGQVFACLGFLEAADVLCGQAEGGFDWAEIPRFILSAKGEGNPVGEVLKFLATAELRGCAPQDWNSNGGEINDLERVDSYPNGEPDKMTLPIVLRGANGVAVCLDHWTDGSSRDEFKLYAGNRSAMSIATTMLKGAITKVGKVKTHGVVQLWNTYRAEMSADPFGTLSALGGSFNFDPRGAWTAIDAGYSPNDHKHLVIASPLVEILAVWGLESARPAEISTRLYRYGVWGEVLPPQLARAALGCSFATIVQRHFRFSLDLSGKNKVTCYAIEENTS